MIFRHAQIAVVLLFKYGTSDLLKIIFVILTNASIFFSLVKRMILNHDLENGCCEK